METIKQTKYLAFVDTDQPETKKTKIIAIVSIHHDEAIGEIRWFSRWRQYCFYPYKETIWNADCLNSVNEVIKELMITKQIFDRAKRNYKNVGVISFNLEDFQNWKKEQKPEHNIRMGATNRIYIYRGKRYICITEINNAHGYSFDEIVETTRAFANPDYEEIVKMIKVQLVEKPMV